LTRHIRIHSSDRGRKKTAQQQAAAAAAAAAAANGQPIKKGGKQSRQGTPGDEVRFDSSSSSLLSARWQVALRVS